jgi:hypothetical protein
MSADFRLGRWQDVLADVECDAWIADAPYSKRVHDAHDSAGALASASGKYTAKSGRVDSRTRPSTGLGYGCLDESEVVACVEHWAPRTRGWFCTLTDAELAGVWRDALHGAGRQTFAPLPVLDHGSNVRLTGDGPSNWTVWLVVARPRTKDYAKWGTLPGAYQRSPGDERSPRMGGKPLGVMRAIVRDYSRAGDLVCDPFAGGGTTLLAALMEGRRAVGSECDPKTHAAASARLARGYTVDMFAGVGT